MYGNEKLKYDENGNRTTDGKYSYTWNEADQLTTITKQGETTPFAKYKYDDDGRRIEKEVNGQITRYFYDGDSINPLYETDGNGNVLRQYVYSIDGVRLAMKAQGQTLFYHYNPHGDVVAMTDSNGQVVANYEYDAWGNVLKSETTGIAADNPFGYAGYMYDKEIGMYYLIARYYNPEHGVFLSVDPDPGDGDDPITQNGYTYGDNNPVMLVDPDGHWVWLAINGGFAVYDGYKAYKSGASAKMIVRKAAYSAIGGGKFKVAKGVLKSGRTLTKIPQKAYKVHNQIKRNNGKAPKGYAGGRTFDNDGRGNGKILPRNTKYREYDVNPLIKKKNRGGQRLVIGNNGKAYYTKNHYKTFVQFPRKKRMIR
ncbi:hypothetical protein bcere0024_029580 [Bacillus cereus Rock4-18]|nr:hypothetical protein bcere0024_029580 [Bacillus cereus Rock4-18]